jgi:hypothetical protein
MLTVLLLLVLRDMGRRPIVSRTEVVSAGELGLLVLVLVLVLVWMRVRGHVCVELRWRGRRSRRGPPATLLVAHERRGERRRVGWM